MYICISAMGAWLLKLNKYDLSYIQIVSYIDKSTRSIRPPFVQQ